MAFILWVRLTATLIQVTWSQVPKHLNIKISLNPP